MHQDPRFTRRTAKTASPVGFDTMRSPVIGKTGPARMIGRGAVLRCARCGSGHLFSSWFHLRERCPGCGMRFEREEGFWLGGYVINFGTGEAFILVLMAVLIGLEANHRPIDVGLFVAIGVVLAVLGPTLTFPFSRTMWTAIDLVMRPLSEEEIVDAQAAVAAAAVAEDDPAVKGRRRAHPRRRRRHGADR
jgi:uncharacterized protein (DUF983 family)